MKRGRTAWVYIVSGALLAPSAHAAAPKGNTYDTVAASNPFRLKPIPPPPPINTEPVKPPMSKLVLQGITDILGEKMALLEVQPPNNAPKTHMTLSEGERNGDIEVVSIDVAAGIVQVKNQGFPDRLDFSVATKTVNASKPSAVIPSATPNVTSTGIFSIPAATPRTIPLPTTRTTTRAGAATPSNVTPVTPAALPSLVGGGGSGSGSTSVAKEAPLKPEEQIILMEINRELTKDKVANGELPPLPPTPLTPAE